METLKTGNDSKRILEHFNRFHDAFIKSLRVYSHDYFKPDKSQTCLGVFDIEIDFAHNNYSQGNPPYNRIVRCYFNHAQRINLSFFEVKCGDWTIKNMDIVQPEKITEDNYFVIKVTFEFYDSNSRQWTDAERELFSFKEATFSEIN